MHPGPLMLQPLDENIWTVAGPQVRVLGFGYPTRMAVIRLKDGGLFIWSPTQLTPDLRAAVDALADRERPEPLGAIRRRRQL